MSVIASGIKAPTGCLSELILAMQLPVCTEYCATLCSALSSPVAISRGAPEGVKYFLEETLHNVEIRHPARVSVL